MGGDQREIGGWFGCWPLKWNTLIMYETLQYNQTHEAGLLSILEQDSDWGFFTNSNSVEKFKKVLANSATYVCCFNGEVCGYIRALVDDCFGVYVSELYVMPKHRNKKNGQNLLSALKTQYPGVDVYVMSDEDSYYEKLGYEKAGSIFKI